MRRLMIPLCLLCLLLVGAQLPAEDAPVKPPALRAGDTIVLVAPSRPVNLANVQEIEAGLTAMGFHVRRAANVGETWGFLAGTDDARATGIMDAWRDPAVQGIFCIIGGSGATRMLDQLDFEYIRQHPKVFTGFSDITALHLAIEKKANLVTFHSPTSKYVYAGNLKERPFATETFWRTVRADKYLDENGQRVPNGWLFNTADLTTPTLSLSKGVARGRLTGGNLSLVAALMGTPYEIETKGKILFLEDIHEEPYRIDRMLSTLRLGGKLDGLAGVVLGRFAECDAEIPKASFSVDEVLDLYFKDRPYPVISRFPVGHVEENATLPIGALAEINGDNATLRLIEDPVIVDAPAGQ